MKRLAITPKDIQIITGKSERFGRESIKSIKETLNKQPHQILTISEYCHFMGLDTFEVLQLLNIQK